ncbi:MAG: ATP-binding protein, partial [Bacteroidota bacterium]
NALKFTEAGKSVEVQYRSEAAFFQISIKDEGPGFSPEDQQKMFRKFQRLSAHPTAGEPSTGLGLSIVKSLVDRLEGEIKLETELGKGSVFQLRFPLR